METTSQRKVWTKDEIKNAILTDDRWVERAIVAIYKRQTSHEQQIGSTMVNNGVGFAHCHAYTGSYYARWINSGKNLTGHHVAKGRKIALRYVGQLTKIANGEI